MVEIIDCKQNSPEWYAARCGLITASNFAQVIGNGKARTTYLYKVAAERIRGEAMDSFTTIYTERGHEYEPVAADLYRQRTGQQGQKIGMFRQGTLGYSPDLIVGDDGLVEIKTKSAHLQIDILMKDEVPTEHKAQLQGGLLVSDRPWIDFVSYCPGLPLFVKRIEVDQHYRAILQKRLLAFEEEVQNTIATVVTKF